ncbi:hypothetical protein [Natrinema gelatinilyticum]|uniref:hypothetical protein n=1 Tax=Natrinema gelatinilyticum TaxID=2961571 RepID=UPI0030F3C7D9
MDPSEVRPEFGQKYREKTSEKRLEPGEVTGPRAIAEAIDFAARQETPSRGENSWESMAELVRERE